MSPASANDPNLEGLSYRVNVIEGLIAPPEQPEVLRILRKTRRFGLQMWDGGYSNQPHILLMELNTAVDEEISHQDLIAFNKLREVASGEKSDQG